LYDQTFAKHYDEGELDKVIVHAQSFFSHVSLKTSIQLQVFPYKETDMSMQVANRDNLVNLVYYVRNHANGLPDADAYALISFQDHEGGRIGLAWLSTPHATRTEASGQAL